MNEQPCVVLLASASAHERRRLRHSLAETPWELEDVTSAKEAARFCGNGRAAILVIDAGLLRESASPEWCTLRERYPEVGTVVRSLVPLGDGILRPEPFTILVNPGDGDGLHEALRQLQSALASPAV